jgi:CrcB protein
MLTNYFAVAVGSAVGGMLRYFLNTSVLSRVAVPFPTVTFVINVTGSFVVGLFLTLAAERINVNPHLRLAVAVGFVGAYTTFSTFEYETLRLVEERHFAAAILNVVLSVAVGFGGVWSGCTVARKAGGGNAAAERTAERR